MSDLVKAIRGRLAGYIQGAFDGKNFGTPPVDDVVSLLKEVQQDYGQVVEKFDDCRAALARRVEQDDDNCDWHTWLIEQSDKAISNRPLTNESQRCQKLTQLEQKMEQEVVEWLSDPRASGLSFSRPLGSHDAIRTLVKRGVVEGSGTQIDPYRLSPSSLKEADHG